MGALQKKTFVEGGRMESFFEDPTAIRNVTVEGFIEKTLLVIIRKTQYLHYTLQK